ncbi:MAG: hypothetical protein ACK40G_10300 [Cytophagaceae bacterium]
MRVWITAVILFISFEINAQQKQKINMNDLRLKYKASVENSALNDSLYEALKNFGKPAVILAYKGGTEALKAKHSSNPYKKLQLLKNSLNTLAAAVAADPDNIEIRFIRYSIEDNLPAFLGMSEHLAEDKAAIIKNFDNPENLKMPIGFLEEIQNYLLQSGRLHPAEAHALDSAGERLFGMARR